MIADILASTGAGFVAAVAIHAAACWASTNRFERVAGLWISIGTGAIIGSIFFFGII